ASSPKANASREEAEAVHTASAAATAAALSSTSDQSAPLSEPISQNSTPRVCSALAEVNTASEVSAENSCITATPESTTLAVVPPESRLSSSTTANAAHAPAKAPAGRVSRPPPRPSTTTSTAPVEAPEDTPSTNGSASGLRSRDCSTAPHTASPAPQA